MIELKINNLDFSYGKKKIFRNFSFSVTDGITLLLGANGSGKSTLFKLISGVLNSKSGTIELFSDGKKTPDKKSAISYIPQNFDVFPTVKVRDILTYICSERDKSLTKSKIEEQVERSIELADIAQYADKKMHTLSGGTKQRVGIAQSILGNPKLIIADEPTAGLDPEQRERYNRIVARTAKNRSFLISTHLYDDTRYYENIALISSGQMRFQGTKNEMTASVDGKIYSFTSPSQDFNEKELNKEATLLSFSESDGQVTARIYCDCLQESGLKNLNSVEATLRDAWLYYCAVSK